MKRILKAPGAPDTLGPYAQAIIANDMVFVSGQIAIIPGTTHLDNKTIEDETHRVMQNLQAILEAAGCGFANVTQARIFIASMDIFSRVNAVYAEYFPEGKFPSRMCLIAEPPVKGAHLEIAVDAVIF